MWGANGVREGCHYAGTHFSYGPIATQDRPDTIRQDTAADLRGREA